MSLSVVLERWGVEFGDGEQRLRVLPEHVDDAGFEYGDLVMRESAAVSGRFHFGSQLGSAVRTRDVAVISQTPVRVTDRSYRDI